MEQAKQAPEVRINRPKTFQELQGDINKANEAIKKNPPPVEKKKNIEVKNNNKGGVRGDVFDKSSFEKSF